MMMLFSIAALIAAVFLLSARFAAARAFVFAPVAGAFAVLAMTGAGSPAPAVDRFDDVARDFAVALKEQRFAVAHGLMCAALQAEMPVRDVQARFDSMVGGAVEHVEVGETLRDWPDKQADDVGWAYVALSGAGFAEAVSLVVYREGARLCIRDVVWGRP